MGDKSWLCVVCGHYIVFAHEAKSIPEGGRAHHYCLEAEKVGAADERERIIKLLEGIAYIDKTGYEMIGEFKSDLIALIKGEQK